MVPTMLGNDLNKLFNYFSNVRISNFISIHLPKKNQMSSSVIHVAADAAADDDDASFDSEAESSECSGVEYEDDIAAKPIHKKKSNSRRVSQSQHASSPLFPLPPNGVSSVPLPAFTVPATPFVTQRKKLSPVPLLSDFNISSSSSATAAAPSLPIAKAAATPAIASTTTTMNQPSSSSVLNLVQSFQNLSSSSNAAVAPPLLTTTTTTTTAQPTLWPPGAALSFPPPQQAAAAAVKPIVKTVRTKKPTIVPTPASLPAFHALTTLPIATSIAVSAPTTFGEPLDFTKQAIADAASAAPASSVPPPKQLLDRPSPAAAAKPKELHLSAAPPFPLLAATSSFDDFQKQAEQTARHMVRHFEEEIRQMTEQHIASLDRFVLLQGGGADQHTLERSRQMIRASATTIESIPSDIIHGFLISMIEYHKMQVDRTSSSELQRIFSFFVEEVGSTLQVQMERHLEQMSNFQLQVVRNCMLKWDHRSPRDESSAWSASSSTRLPAAASAPAAAAVTIEPTTIVTCRQPTTHHRQLNIERLLLSFGWIAVLILSYLLVRRGGDGSSDVPWNKIAD
jgi:hypothetical protein